MSRHKLGLAPYTIPWDDYEFREGILGLKPGKKTQAHMHRGTQTLQRCLT